MIDENIEIDLSLLPKSVVEEIKELERFHEKKDWFFYDLKFDELENDAKGYVINKKISESLYKKLLAKYGGLYDWNKQHKGMIKFYKTYNDGEVVTLLVTQLRCIN